MRRRAALLARATVLHALQRGAGESLRTPIRSRTARRRRAAARRARAAAHAHAETAVGRGPRTDLAARRAAVGRVRFVWRPADVGLAGAERGAQADAAPRNAAPGAGVGYSTGRATPLAAGHAERKLAPCSLASIVGLSDERRCRRHQLEREPAQPSGARF